MLIAALTAVLLALIGFGGCVLLLQRNMLFPGTARGADPAAAAHHPGIEVLWLELEGGRLETWILPPVARGASGPHPYVIFAHGNFELIDDWPEALRGFPELGVGVMLVEYPGYGRSQGKPSEASIRDSMLAAYDTLAARPDVDPLRIVLYGRSLGGAAVCSMLGERPVAALVLQSTFTSVADIARELGFVPAALVRDPFRSAEAVQRYAGPVLVMHGSADDIIPYTHGVALSQAATRGRLITYACRHNDFPPDWRAFWRDLGDFLRETGVLQPAG